MVDVKHTNKLCGANINKAVVKHLIKSEDDGAKRIN